MSDQKEVENLCTMYTTQCIDTTEDSAIFKLDDDSMRHIFSYLSISDRVRIQRVCKTWQLLGKLPWTDKKFLLVKNKLFDHFENGKGTVEIKDSISTLPILEQVLSLCGSSLTNIYIDHFDKKKVAVGILTLIHKYCLNLMKLNMSGIILNHNVIEYLTRHYNKLQHINIGRCFSQYESALLRFFQSSTKLCSVSLYRLDDLTGSCLQGLPNTIEEIEIDDCEGFELNRVLNCFQRWKNFRSLSITDNMILLLHIDQLLYALPNKLNLEELFLDTYAYMNSKRLVQLTTNLFHFTNLRMLRLTGNIVLFDEVLTILGKYCINLKQVCLARSNRVTDIGWQNFVKLLNLESLIIQDLNKLSDKFLNYLPESSLKNLQCGQVPVTNESLRLLMQKSENLELLEVYDKNVNIEMLISNALDITNRRTHNKILRIHYGSGDKEQMISPRLIVKMMH